MMQNKLVSTLKRIEEKHQELLALKPRFTKELEENLYQWFRVALTYTSNAIEGNTLSHVETAEIIDKNITIQGKSLTEHLEVLNHIQALDFAKELSEIKKRQNIEIADILQIHEFILQKINNTYAGRLRDVSVRIMGSNIPVPNYAKVPKLMDNLITWLHTSEDSVIKIAADTHLKLVYIHPFIDGNGRTARLLMNLVLLQKRYPLVYINAEDRLKYIKAIQKACSYVSYSLMAEDYVLNSNSLEISDFQDYYIIVFDSIERSLDEYINAAKESGL